MMAIFAKLSVKPEHTEHFMTFLRADVAGTLAEPGCLRFDVIRDEKSADTYYLYEVYRDAEAFADHQKTPHFQAFFGEAKSLLAASPEGYFGEIQAM